MHVVFLGTGGSWPSPQRNVAAVAVRIGPEVVLFDCGEGTQRQLMKSTVSFMKIDRIFITHFHGDHFLGLPGLIQSMALNDRKEPLDIYGPSGTEALVESLLSLGHFSPTYDVRAADLEPGTSIEFERYTITAVLADHSVPCFAYAIEEPKRPGKFNKERALELGVPEGPMFSKLQGGEPVTLENGTIVEPSMVMGPPRSGRKLVYTGDTKPSPDLEELARDADLLIHDATAAADNEEKANLYGHSSARQAAEFATKVGAHALALIHVSPRYDDAAPLRAEAKEKHPNVLLPDDLGEYEVPLRES